MNTAIELLKRKIVKIPDTGNERSYYTALCNFFDEYGKTVHKLRAPQSIAEESLTKDDKHIGFPDITVRNGESLIGWIEVKMPDEDLGAEKFKPQFGKYKDSLENIIFTNLREWQLWQWTKDGTDEKSKVEPRQTARVHFDITTVDGADSSDFETFLAKFFDGRAHETRTPKQLALALAKKTRLLSKQVEEALEQSDETNDLAKLQQTFSKTLIQDVTPHQFANMVAETLAYSLFLAALEHAERDSNAEFSLETAIRYLPTNVPILADLYSLVTKVSSTIPSITDAARLLVDQLNAADITRIRQKLVEHKPGEDPVIQFYEPFLHEYDPKEREARGVYYTPKPVVDYIVKSVDFILRDKFGKANGLADNSVHLLDPATGTGTFLMSAIQRIYWDTKKQNEAQGEEMVRKAFNDIVLNHILKHFYGFELLIAPYAIAHLKLTLEVERLGFDFRLTRNDADKDNDRFKIYLANTLDDPNQAPAKLFVGYEAIPQESESARKVKKDVPILAIVGNPPYSVSSSNKGKWIEELMESYKKGVKNERNIQPLSDDYIKFIRFAQWKIHETGSGIIALITNNSFLGGLVHRGMREELIKEFDFIHILDLHGHSAVNENAADQNIFDIRQGVSITFLIKDNSKKENAEVHYADLIGERTQKFDFLLNHSFQDTQWRKVNVENKQNFFIPQEYDADYESLASVKDIFLLQRNNPMTGVDDLLVDSDRASLIEKVQKIFNGELDDILGQSQAGKIILKKLKETVFNPKRIYRINYRPLNFKFIYFEPKFLWRSVPEITNQFLDKTNLALVTSRVTKVNKYSNIICSHLICDYKLGEFSRGSYSFPLYAYTTSQQSNLLNDESRRHNFSSEFVKLFSEKIDIPFVSDGRGDCKKTFGPEDIFYYAYAIFHSPTYRKRYIEDLKIDFPRLPLTSDKVLFARLVRLGNELVNLHLLGENPFDNSKTIFDESEQWKIKIGSVESENSANWKVTEVRYIEKDKRIYVNTEQYFEGIENEVWEFMIGGYQVCEKWLKDRKKSGGVLSTEDLKHFMKIVISLRETIRIMKEIDEVIPEWPIK